MGAAADELVDVIDQQGRTIGTVTRREMRERRLPHRCVYVLVFNRAGQLLIHQRTPSKDVFPLYWDVAVGGVLATGEDFATGARRETAEEIGVTGPLEPLFPFAYEDARTVVQAMVYRLVHDGPFLPQPEEVLGTEFVSVTALAGLVQERQFSPDGCAVFAEYRRRWGAEVS